MSYQNALTYLAEKIQEDIAFKKDGLVNGVIDFAEYKRLCGVIQGLNAARELILDLAKRMENDDAE